MRQYAERLAVRAVLERAARLVGPLRGAMHTVVEPLREPHQGELELDETLDNLIGKEFPEPHDWMIERREERRTQIVLMMDTSLSMAGANMALVGRGRRRAWPSRCIREDLSVVVFESKADVISKLEDADPPEHVVEGDAAAAVPGLHEHRGRPEGRPARAGARAATPASTAS